MLQAEVPGLVLLEAESASRRSPNWNSILVGHSQTAKSKSLIVRTKNTKSNIRERSERYRAHKNLPVVEHATALYWSQLKLGPKQSFVETTKAFHAHYRILLTLVRITHGVIDLPEHEKIYTATGFARHIRSIAQP